MKLYHGSLVDIQDCFLQPRKAFDREDYPTAVSLTENRIIALLYSTNPIRAYFQDNNIVAQCGAFSCHINRLNDCVCIEELYEGMFDDVFNRSAFIYTCNVKADSVEKWNDEYRSSTPVLISRKEKIENVYTILTEFEKDGKVKLYHYNDVKENWNHFDDLMDSVVHRMSYSASPEEKQYFLYKFKHVKEFVYKLPKEYKDKI